MPGSTLFNGDIRPDNQMRSSIRNRAVSLENYTFRKITQIDKYNDKMGTKDTADRLFFFFFIREHNNSKLHENIYNSCESRVIKLTPQPGMWAGQG